MKDPGAADSSLESDSSGEDLPIPQDLLEKLRCPLTRMPLVLKGSKLYCYESRKAYRIEDGIPVMLVEEAEEIPESEVPPEFRDKPALTPIFWQTQLDPRPILAVGSQLQNEYF